MKSVRIIKPLIVAALVAALAIAGFFTRDRWLPLITHQKSLEATEPTSDPARPPGKIIVNEQTQENLGLKAKPLKPQAYWKTIPVPGMVVDRPGISDRSIVAPAICDVAKINHFPGDTVRPGNVLFTLRILSDSLHLTQTELAKATKDIELAFIQRKRLTDSGGAIPESRVIEVDAQITRLQVAVKAYRQELQNRGFTTPMIDGVAGGKLVKEIDILVPPLPGETGETANSLQSKSAYQVQELKVDLGQQVQVGQTLCLLANHRLLAVEGRAFRDETPLLERSVQEKWPIEVDFQEDPTAGWGELTQTFRIRYMANTIDPQTRTFAFVMPLENQSRSVEDEGRTQTLWRFRPGQKCLLKVRVQELKDVFVLPADAVAQDGPEAFVFTQNVNTFERMPVRILSRDGKQVVLANDRSMPAGTFIVQSAAAQLNRMVKSGGASGVPKGYHIHADGSLHKNEDEGK